MTDSSSIVIDGVTVRRDQHGRFCLNDLHAAAGGAHRHRPPMWLRNAQAREVIADRLNSLRSEFGPVEVKRGRYGSTYAIKQLVYSYAMWVSPRFHNQVVDAYDAMARVAEPGHVLPSNLAHALRDMADLVEKNEALTQQVAQAAEPIEFFGAVAVAPGTQTFREVGKVYDMSDRQLIAFLANKGHLFRQGKSWVAKQSLVTAGYFQAVTGIYNGVPTTQTRVTGKGQQFIQRCLRLTPA